MTVQHIGGAAAELVVADGAGGFKRTFQPFLSDGVSLAADAMRGNVELTLLASAARTASTYTAEQSNVNARGLLLLLNVTAASGTGGVRPYLYAVDPIGGGTALMWFGSTPQTAVGLYVYAMYPTAFTLGNLTQATGQALPRRWKALVSHADGSGYTYSLAGCYLL